MLRIGIVGVTGYTGMELVRILHGHPEARLTYASSRSWAGRELRDAMPHLDAAAHLVLSRFDVAQAAGQADFFFVCLPHGEAMETVASLRQEGRKVVDLSADFRLEDLSAYEHWYGRHSQKELLQESVYGLPELYRERVRTASLVANPGCYPTSVILGLAPALARGLIEPGGIVVDSKSGVSGAGREPGPAYHFPETFGNFSAYKIAGRHRHISEMEQELGRLAEDEIRITFTPHLLPVSRGILSTIYARPVAGLDEKTLCSAYEEYFREEPFVRVSGNRDDVPSLKDVRGTNLCRIGPRLDDRSKTVVIVSCLDNLVKGASGQAVQNMNLMMGFDESLGLDVTPLHP